MAGWLRLGVKEVGFTYDWVQWIQVVRSEKGLCVRVCRVL